jgi:hypothetical protein
MEVWAVAAVKASSELENVPDIVYDHTCNDSTADNEARDNGEDKAPRPVVQTDELADVSQDDFG